MSYGFAKNGAWFRRGRMGAGFRIAMPWSRKYFSERNGYVKPVASFCGIRIFKLEAYFKCQQN